jgi:hypothetical protein
LEFENFLEKEVITMKTRTKLIGFLVSLSLFCALPAFARGQGSKAQGVRSNQTMQSLVPLSSAEQDTLLWMREEEKVARDVYLTLYKVWKKPVFNNIATAEQRHMDAILKKITIFGLTDPVLPSVGTFSHSELQVLYDDMIAQGKRSYVDSLVVGATIEDKDIMDLVAAIKATDNLSLKTTYENLLEGSKNHLRAFVGLLRKQGMDYAPQFIDQALFDAILGV